MKELKRNFHKKEGANENHKKLLSSYHSNVANFIEGVFKSRSKKIFPETMMPNFSKDNCIDKYAKDNINIEEYKVKSESGDELVFAMAYDEKGRVYIDNIYNPNSKVSSYGTLDEITQMGHLVYKPEDYDEQATIGFPNNYREIIDFTSYSDISKLWENIPVIKRFKNELISRGDIKKEEESAKEDGSVEKTTKDEGVDERDKGVDKKTDKPIFDRVKDRVFKSEESEEPKKEKDKESKKGEGDPETVETVEETPEIEIENTEEEGEGVNEEILRALEDINVSIEDMKKINGFEALSPGAQLLAINNYKQIIDDDAVKEGLEKINKRKRLKKEQYQEKYGKRKGSILSGITSIFGGAKRKEAAYKESLTDIKDKDFDSKRFALEASVNWVTGADISAEIKEGKIEFNFINKAEVDEEAHEIVDELNSIATKFAKMPQYFSNISAKKRDKRNYEKIKEELENKKTELVEVLKGKESESKIINQLNKLNFKITNLQNNLTDEEINELEKSNSKFLNLFKSKKAEKGYYFIGGLVARAGIKKKFGEKASEEALEAGLGAGATALASYGTLGIAAAIGGIRGWRKAEKSIREDDKMIGKKEETEIMKIRREKLKALREANPENADQAQKEFDEANKNFLKEQMRNKTEANFLFASKANDKIEKLVGNIRDLNSKENLNEEEKNKLNQLRESLKSRIKYTRDKIDNGLIALGSGANRLVNSSNLFNSITQAEVLMEGLDYSEFRESSKKEDYNPDKSIDRRIEILLSENLSDFIPDEFIDKKGKIDIVAWLNQASPEEKSAYRQRKIEGYLKSRSKKIDIKRRNYKIKKAAIGAVSGAALAYTGMKSFDALSQTEAGQFIGEKISDSLKWGVDQGQGAVNYLKETLGGVESLEKVIPSVDDVDIASDSASEVFSESSSEVGGENISEVDVINEASRVEGIESSESYGEAISTEEGVGEGVGEEVEEVISTEEGVGEGTEEGVEEVVDKEADSAYIPTSFEELEKADLLTKVVSNENLKPGQTDSVWRSLRSIFMDNAEDLGYKGDMDDAASLRSWADNQTANTINTTVEKTGELKDLIHEGNKVSLLKDEDGDMIFDVEKADGRFEPSTLPKKEPIIEQEFKIPEEMESRPISGIETKRPSIPGLESVEEVINEGDSLVNEELTTQAGGVAEEIPKTVEEIPKKESNYDEMASLVDSIGEEDGLKSDVEQTYEKWADSIEKQGAEEITDNTVSDQVESDIPGEQLDSEGKVDESTFLGDDLDQGTEEVVKEVPDEPAEQEDINEVLGTKTAESMFDSSSVSQKTYEIQKYLISNRNVIPKEALEDLENTFIVGGRETIFGNIRGGTETSLASELNKIMGIEDFYQNLNEIHQLGFRSVINDIIDGNPNSQRLAINRLSKLISSIN